MTAWLERLLSEDSGWAEFIMVLAVVLLTAAFFALSMDLDFGKSLLITALVLGTLAFAIVESDKDGHSG